MLRIKRISLSNLGPIKQLTITPRFSKEGLPVPIAIVGQNGAGKSLALSVLIDAITEIRRGAFAKLREVEPTDYLRVSTRHYIRGAADFSHAQAVFSTSGRDLEFNEVVSRSPGSQLLSADPSIASLPNIHVSEFGKAGFYKYIEVPDAARDEIKQSLFLYFPHFRYEVSYWMNKSAKVDFVQTASQYGDSRINPIRANIIEETKIWILNVLLDREIYEKQIRPVLVDGVMVNLFDGYSGPNSQMFSLINELLYAMLKAKNPKIESARVGISRKGSREISVIARNVGGHDEVIAPDLAQLSSGELMTLGLVTEIVRAHELVKGRPPLTLNEIDGVVLIDEVDLHLHISFQKTVLPILFRKFPNVQFVFTTHSPFFALGMAECGELDIYNFPIGNKIAANQFDEFNAGYDVFVGENENFRRRYEEVETQSKVESRPLIITEGKTDWKHLKFALNQLQNTGDYKDIDVDFLEFESDVNMGDVRLSQMCEHMATIAHKRKMIFVFDRDNPDITKKVSGDPGQFKSWNNNVYSICLPVPPHREKYKNLSIELYYTDDLIKQRDPRTGKRLWFNNEIEVITRPATGQKTYRAQPKGCEEDEYSKKIFDQPADEIVDSDGNKVGLSKSAFTQKILDNEYSLSDKDLTAFRLFFEVLREVCVTL